MEYKRFNNDQHLNYEDLRAYQKGNLSNKEMHRLELHLVDCTLCNDALAGLANIDEAELDKHISNIKIKTGTKQDTAKPLKKILAIAASVMLIAIVSVILFNLQEKPTLVAEHIPDQAEEAPLTKEGETEIIAKADTSESVIGQVVTEEAIAATTTPQESPNAALAKTTPAPTRDTTENILPLDEVDNSMAEIAFTENPDSSIMVADTAPEPEETLQETEQQVAVMAEQDRTGARSKKVTSTYASDTQGLAEVVITESSYKPASPVKGQRAYKRYLRRNLSYPAQAKENNIDGNVVLQLIIAEDGSLKKINIIQSLGYGCDEEAIRLIKDGPKWAPGKRDGFVTSDTVSVTVPFKL